MVYRYLAYTNDRRLIRGTIESSSIEIAEDSLYKSGFQRIINLKESGSRIDWKKIFLGKPKISKQGILDFTTELAILTESGLTLRAALKQLERQSSGGSLKKVLSKVAADLQEGTPFNKAIAKYPQIFSETYCSMIEAHEKSGTMDSGLRQIAKELKQQVTTKSQIQHALMQPAIVTVVAVIVVFLLTIVVLPKLVDIFKQFGTQLPFITRMLILFTDFVNAYKFDIVIVVLALILAVTTLSKQHTGRQLLDKIILKLPMIGQMVLWNNTARFSRTMANLLKSGILLPDTMAIVLRTISNTYIREAVNEVRKRLLQGQAFSTSIGSSKLFPKLLIDMVMVGECSGTLESSLESAADYYEAKLQRSIGKLTTLLEPALIIILGLGVGIIAVSVISAIYGLVGSMS
jgi:type IV pilus assembly protein PilC